MFGTEVADNDDSDKDGHATQRDEGRFSDLEIYEEWIRLNE